MMPGRYDLEHYSGDDLELDLLIERKAEDGTKSPVDFTGHVGAAQVRESVESDVVLVELAVGFPDPVNGRVKIEATAAQTEDLRVRGVWDFQTTDSNGKVKTWVAGDARISGDVTR